MKILTATAVRRRFGAFLKAVQEEPVLVQWRNGKKVMVISAEKYRLMTGITRLEPDPAKMPRKMVRPKKSR